MEQVEERLNSQTKRLRQRSQQEASRRTREDKRHANDKKRTAVYVAAFREWMEAWKPHAFVTVNLPKELDKTRVQRTPHSYLNCWTRCAEAGVLGTRTLKQTTYDRRIVWMFRREVAPDGLIHYHGPAWFPLGRTWREETPGRFNVGNRCERLQLALRLASSRTPEPFTPKNVLLPNAADIDVIPFDIPERDHPGYTLKGMWHFGRESVIEQSPCDSDLIIVPHLPKRGA